MGGWPGQRPHPARVVAYYAGLFPRVPICGMLISGISRSLRDELYFKEDIDENRCAALYPSLATDFLTLSTIT